VAFVALGVDLVVPFCVHFSLGGGTSATVKSYDELLHEASDRYRDLYAKLVPDGIAGRDFVIKGKSRKTKTQKRVKTETTEKLVFDQETT
jgi:hypothetical protein